MSKKSEKKSTKERQARRRRLTPVPSLSSPSPAVARLAGSEPVAGDRSSGGMRIIIEPSDAWLFRDGKPFRAGEDHWATSHFPPTPLTMQGVIRSKILLDSGTDLADYAANPSDTDLYAQIGGKGQDYGTLEIRGPYLAREENGGWVRYYPAPADLLCDKETQTFCRLTVGSAPIIANWPHADDLRPLYPPEGRNKVEPAGGWVAADALQAYLMDGKLPQPEQVVRATDIYGSELRIAIGLDRRVRRPRSQLLAEIGMVRLADNWALDVEVSGVAGWSSPGYLGIGGEARSAYYQVLSPDWPLAPPAPIPNRFTLYFAAPTCFKNGWLPESWQRWFTGGQVNLVAAVVNRPKRTGGWDIVLGEKPMRAYVPAGSSYYFEGKGEITYNGEPVTDDSADGQIGFGQAFIGKWS
jgi:CRISPR-associated protein Cmr3